MRLAVEPHGASGPLIRPVGPVLSFSAEPGSRYGELKARPVRYVAEVDELTFAAASELGRFLAPWSGLMLQASPMPAENRIVHRMAAAVRFGDDESDGWGWSQASLASALGYPVPLEVVRERLLGELVREIMRETAAKLEGQMS